MLLSDKGILDEIDTGEIEVSPFNLSFLSPASLDVHLGGEFLFPAGDVSLGIVDPAKKQAAKKVKPDHGELGIPPNQFLLGSTVEKLTLGRNVAARFEGKSSLGRLGIMVHVTAGFIDPGFSGTVTIEIVNLSGRPAILRIGQPIGQLCFFRLDQPVEHAYGLESRAHYQNQRGPVASRSHVNFYTLPIAE